MTTDQHFGDVPVHPGVSPPAPTAKNESGGTSDTARQQAAQVGSAATDAAGATVNTAKEQVGNVASEAAGQVRDLWSQTSSDISAQTAQQTERLTANIRQLADHLSGMADSGESGSPARTLVREAGQRAQGVANYLDGRRPGDFVTDIQQFGRRRPGTFLLGAAAAGFLAGRLIKAAKNAEPTADQQYSSMGVDRSTEPSIDLRNNAPMTPAPLPGATGLPPALPEDAFSMPAGGDVR